MDEIHFDQPFHLMRLERLFLIVERGGIFMANTDTFSYIYIYMYFILDRTNTVQLNEPTLSNMLQHSSFAL